LKTLNPILNRVLVKPEPKELVRDSGIILSDEADINCVHPLRDGVVVAVGPGNPTKDGKLKPMTVKVGDRVQFSGYAGISLSGKEGKDTKLEETLLTEEDIFFIYGDSK